MTTVRDLEHAVARLGAEELATFRSWFEAFDVDRFDSRIDEDARSGKLDALVVEALEDRRRGDTREL